jgi:superfamily II DNA helicase RecQ
LKSGLEEEKGAILSGWLNNPKQPVIATTSTLGAGFNYPYIQWVVYIDAPNKITDFSQESRRVGRDSRPASSIIIIQSI